MEGFKIVFLVTAVMVLAAVVGILLIDKFIQKEINRVPRMENPPKPPKKNRLPDFKHTPEPPNKTVASVLLDSDGVKRRRGKRKNRSR